MKVTKAIEILRNTAISLKSSEDYDTYISILLGIAALEKHQDRDYRGWAQFIERLPGED